MKRSLDDPQERTALLTRLRMLSPDSTRQWGRMNAHQAVCHLSDSFRIMMSSAPAPSQSNLFTRSVVRWVALHSGMQWPHGVKTMPAVDQEIGGTKPLEFENDRRKLEELAEQFAQRTSANLQPHPIFGHLSSTEWQRWGYLHMDHHLRQFGK
jgi:Protein of unknown function (DUF1569)